MGKLGVVIFNDDYFSDEGLAALKWASDFLLAFKQSSLLPGSKPSLLILLVKVVAEQSQTAGNREKKVWEKEDLYRLVVDKAKEKNLNAKCVDDLDRYIKKFEVSVSSYEGSEIHEILKEAINDDDQLTTLVLGKTAVLGSTLTAEMTDLLLNSKCSVVLAKTDRPAPTNN